MPVKREPIREADRERRREVESLGDAAPADVARAKKAFSDEKVAKIWAPASKTSKISRADGFDRSELDPAPSMVAGLGSPAMTAGGDLFSDRAKALEVMQQGRLSEGRAPNALTADELDTLHRGLPKLVTDLRTALLELARVDKVGDLGKAGPLDASAAPGSLFKALFGRDSEKIARQLQSAYPEVGRRTILRLAELQGVKPDARSDEEPGKILHEYRPKGDPIGDLELVPKWGELPYYGTVDATPNFINMVAEHVEQHGPQILDEKVTQRNGRSVTVREAVEQATSWIERRLDTAVGGGMLWVQRSQPDGIPFQSWIDSADSRFDANGKVIPLDRPHLPLQDQGYAYRALRNAAALERSAGKADRADALDRRALELRKTVIDNFWMDDLGVFSPTLIPGQRGRWQPMRVVSSEAWALLDSRLLDGDDVADKRERLVKGLAADELGMLAKGGIRTKSDKRQLNPRYWASSYQNGSSWPHDTKEVADGLRRYGYHSLADDLELRLLFACVQNRSFPEYVQGLASKVSVNTQVVDVVEPDGTHNRLEQPPQDPQGWTVSSVFGILFGHGIIDADLNYKGTSQAIP